MNLLELFVSIERAINTSTSRLNRIGDEINQMGNSPLLDSLPFGGGRSEESAERQTEAYISLMDEAERKIREAMDSTKCGVCRRDINDVLNVLSVKREKLLDNSIIIRIMEERGLKSWGDLNEATKKEIREEVERRKNARGR